MSIRSAFDRRRAGIALVALVGAASIGGLSMPEDDRFPGLIAAQGAFTVERPYGVFIALGRFAPAADYILLGDPERSGSPWRGSRRWLEEQFVGSAGASDVVWRPAEDGPPPSAFLPPAGRRIWEGPDSFFGWVEVITAVDDSADPRTFIVFPTSESSTAMVDARLLPTGP